MKRLLPFLLAATTLAACDNASNNQNADAPGSDSAGLATATPGPIPTAPPATGDSVLLAGTYTGNLPCPDCDGIETSITLATDQTFTRTVRYLGRKNSEPATDRGQFDWDKSEGRITIPGANGSAATVYRAGDGRLDQLDEKGGVMTGNYADRYTLRKQ